MMSSSDDQYDDVANRDEELSFLIRAVKFMEGAMNADEIAFFNAELQQSESKLVAFASLQFQGAVIRHSMRQAAYEPKEPLTPTLPEIEMRPEISGDHKYARALVVLAATVLISVGAFVAGAKRSIPSKTKTLASARLVSSWNAMFFGERMPSADTAMERERDYVLTKGLIELLFPSGAMAIIESPSVFRIVDGECLTMDAGRCSVHAPDGAEGFRVLTPTTEVVDRGTKFVVSVAENSVTEVQVLEGAADVYPSHGDAAGVHLVNANARRFSSAKEGAIEIPFSPERYRTTLPDRIVRYDAVKNPDGRYDELKSVTVQRGGRLQKVLIEELIGVRLTYFRSNLSADPNGHFACGPVLPEDRLSLLEDNRLATGIINPGGSAVPRSATPDSETPGFKIRFQSPVVNGAGPDVVFFELQCLTNPLEGDAFHVSPVTFSRSSKSHTIRDYDLTLMSRETKPIRSFSLHRFSTAIGTVQQLVTTDSQESPVRLGFSAVAVGVDLSDLGFVEGESVEELFFQDASDDDKSLVDPVFIAGLPSP